jgi:hypothetical protein
MVDLVAPLALASGPEVNMQGAKSLGKVFSSFSEVPISRVISKAVAYLGSLQASVITIISNRFFHKKNKLILVDSLGIRTRLLRENTLSSAKILLKILEEHGNYIVDPTLIRVMAFEIVAKKFAYCPIFKGDQIRLPRINNKEELVWEDYQVDQKMFIGNHIPVFGLLPVLDDSAPPVIVFKGSSPPNLNSLATKKDAVTTWKADLDKNGVGVSLFTNSKEKVADWLLKARGSSQIKALAIGHSLGGAFAMLTSIKLSSLIKEAIIYNAPMARRQIKEEYDNLADETKPSIFGFFCKEDLVPKIGGSCLVGKHYEISNFCDYLDHHNDVIMLSSKKFSFQEVDVEKVNQTRHIMILGSLTEPATAIAHAVVSPALERLERLALYCFDLS